MWPDRVSNPGPLTYESGALPIALRWPGSLHGLTLNAYRKRGKLLSTNMQNSRDFLVQNESKKMTEEHR